MEWSIPGRGTHRPDRGDGRHHGGVGENGDRGRGVRRNRGCVVAHPVKVSRTRRPESGQRNSFQHGVLPYFAVGCIVRAVRNSRCLGRRLAAALESGQYIAEGKRFYLELLARPPLFGAASDPDQIFRCAPSFHAVGSVRIPQVARLHIAGPHIPACSGSLAAACFSFISPPTPGPSFWRPRSSWLHGFTPGARSGTKTW